MSGSRARRIGLLAAGLTVASGAQGWAVTFETMNGAPVQMQPYVDEPGAPTVTVPLGTTQPFVGSSGSTSLGGGSGSSGSSEALTTLYGTSWGAIAAANAMSVNVNPSALASVCVAETTTCNSSASNGSFTGAFQMGSAAFHDGLNAALAANPALASQIVSGSGGISDPTTQAIAASGYILLGNTALQNSGIASPTALDFRSFHNFGPTYGVSVAQSPPTALMSEVLPSSWLQQNGITQSETVGAWRASVASKIGTATNQTLIN